MFQPMCVFVAFLSFCKLFLWVGATSLTAQTSPPIPPVCRDLPLPSSMPFALDQYEERLGAFLRAECYRLLSWTHDVSVRNSGPWIAQITPGTGNPKAYQWIANNYGLHGTVFVYYSPDVYRWMQERDAAVRDRRDLNSLRPIADGAMIVKLMLGGNGATAADFPDITKLPPAPIALMVKDAKGSKDGWFWGVWDPSTKAKDQLDWPPPANFPWPWMEAGNISACIVMVSWGSDSSAWINSGHRASAAATQVSLIWPPPSTRQAASCSCVRCSTPFCTRP